MQNVHPSLDEAEIIRRVVDGDVNLFELLIERHKHHVQVLVQKHVPFKDVDDVSQEVFIRAYLSLPGFRRESGFKTWLSSIAVKTCYDHWRKKYRSREVPMSSLTDRHQAWLADLISEDSTQAARELGSRTEAGEMLEWALAKLSAADRMVVNMVHIEGLSIKEAANLLGWSTTNVKVRAFRARRKLQDLLTGFLAGRGKET